MMALLALDLSLTATGWATSIDEHGVYRPSITAGVERLQDLQNWLYVLATDDDLHGGPAFDFAVIEGYAYSRVNQQGVRSTAEWGGVARLTLYQAGVPFVEIDPSTLKKYATGKGNSPKPTMRMELYKRAGIDVADDNTVDAIWLLAAAMEATGTPMFAMPKANVAALDKVKWPVVKP